LRGGRIVRQLQARALAERGYALSPDELATTLGGTTTLPGDVIARLAHGHGEDRLAAGAAGGRVDGFSSDFSGRSPGEGDIYRARREGRLRVGWLLGADAGRVYARDQVRREAWSARRS